MERENEAPAELDLAATPNRTVLKNRNAPRQTNHAERERQP